MQTLALQEGTLVQTDGLFAAAVEHLGRRLGRVKPLDAAALPSDRATAVAALDAWAAGDVDWRGELRRFYEDTIPVHVRPSARVNGALRRLHGHGVRLVWITPGPREASEVLLHHLGVAGIVELADEGGRGPAGARLVGGAAELAELADLAARAEAPA